MKTAKGITPAQREKARKDAMPEVKALVKKYGRSVVYGCLVKLTLEKKVKLPKNFGKMK